MTEDASGPAQPTSGYGELDHELLRLPLVRSALERYASAVAALAVQAAKRGKRASSQSSDMAAHEAEKAAAERELLSLLDGMLRQAQRSIQAFSPFMMKPDDAEKVRNDDVDHVSVSDEALLLYAPQYIESYRDTIERYFPSFGPHLSFYAKHPFETRLLRMGEFDVTIGFTPASKASVRIMRLADFDPPLETINLIDILDRWQAPFASFDFSGQRSYSVQEAQIAGMRHALNDALLVFWSVITPEFFEKLCRELLAAEEIELKPTAELGTAGTSYDGSAQLIFDEPAGFWRKENWAFAFKHFRADRLSVSVLREIEEGMLGDETSPDVVCVLTSGDITSIGNHIAVTNPRVRVWDRDVLNRLIDRHLQVIAPYFADYEKAAGSLSEAITAATAASALANRKIEFTRSLEECPPGHAHFSAYENIGIEIWEYLFSPNLGSARRQSTTLDGVQRRDVLFRNNRSTRFWERVAVKLHCDFLIVDFKNYKDPVTAKEVWDVSKYASQVLGNLIIIVCRSGPDATVEPSQVRLFDKRQVAVLIVSDKQLIEMMSRKEKNEAPEDVIEDQLDALLLRC